jgi:hypothetical protein
VEDRIVIVKNGIFVDREALRNIVINQWRSGKLYQFHRERLSNLDLLPQMILSDISDYADDVSDEIEQKAQQDFGRPGVFLDWEDKYPKSDYRSIGFEVLSLLSRALGAKPEKLTTDDIPAILEFLDTPSGKELEAWDKWEKYWASLDYPARRKKLLGDEGKK